MPDCANCPDAGEFMEHLIRENARLKNENEQLKQAAEKEVHNNIQEDPCIGCNHGWASISAEKITSCVESCAEYKLYCKQQFQPPKEEEDATD